MGEHLPNDCGTHGKFTAGLPHGHSLTTNNDQREALYLIRKGALYYRPNAQGYTASKHDAGRYSLEDAISHSHPNGPDGPRDGMSYELAPTDIAREGEAVAELLAALEHLMLIGEFCRTDDNDSALRRVRAAMIRFKSPPEQIADHANCGEVALRVARGMSRRPVSACKHRPLVYDQKERRIWCKDCESDVEPFDAFTMICEHFHHAAARLERERQEIEEAKVHNLIRVAAKKMDELFRRKNMVPACPHCGTGIFPEDVPKMSSVNREWEQAKRDRKGKT